MGTAGEAAPARDLPSRGLAPDGTLRTGRLAGLSMNAAIWVLTWPILVESFLNSTVGLTDTVLAARLGESETDAVGGASYVMWLIGLVFMSVGTGATAMISRSIGKGRLAVANTVLGQTVLLSVVLGALVGVIVALLTPVLAAMLGLDPAGAHAFKNYLFVICAGAPVSMLLFCGIACARGAGDSKRPLIAMILRNVVNMIASFVLSGVDVGYLKNPFSFDLGVMGIAIGTILGDTAGTLLILSMAMKGTWGIRLRAKRLRPHAHTLRRMIRLGIPSFLETLGMWFGNFLIVLFVGWLALGAGGLLGAHIVAIRIEAFSFLPGFAIGTACATLVGQYLGAGAPHLARVAIRRCTVLAGAIMGVLGVAFIVFPRDIVFMLSEQPTHLAYTPDLIVIAGWVQIPFGINIVLRSALRGAGDVKAAMWLIWICTYAVRLPMAYLLSGVSVPLPAWFPFWGGQSIPHPLHFGPDHNGLYWLWIALCAEVVIRTIAFAWRYATGAWARQRV
jgi:putative MATE family efflux protein